MQYLWKKLLIILFLISIFFNQTLATEINNTKLLILDKSSSSKYKLEFSETYQFRNLFFEVVSCKNIEFDLGRKKTKKNSPRECDIDILDYDNKKINEKILAPHPRMHERNFVLFPLFEINKEWKHPILKYSIKKLILLLPNKDIRSIKQI